MSTEYQRYVTATQTFRDKYFAFPGDFSSATRVWLKDSAASNCITNFSALTATTGTCDGDGDNVIYVATAAIGASGEMMQLWRQLALAGLIEGSYTGVTDTASNDSILLGTNAPSSKLSNAGWAVSSGQPSLTSAYTMQGGYGNHFIFGRQSTGNVPVNPALEPEEAWNIDTKLDDGKPAYGKIIARPFNNTCGAADDGSTHTTTNLASSYKLSDTSLRCILYFIKSL